jgi:hypothetical protein
MRLLVTALCSLMGAAPAVARLQQLPLENPITVQVGMFVLQPDGSSLGLAFGTNDRVFEPFASLLETDGCRFGASDKEAAGRLPATGRDAWRIDGRVISLSAEQATIQLDWQRVRAVGVNVEAPTESRQLTLPLNQLLTLEPIPRLSDSACDFPPAVFGARYAPSPVIADSNGPSMHDFRVRRLGIRNPGTN